MGNILKILCMIGIAMAMCQIFFTSFLILKYFIDERNPKINFIKTIIIIYIIIYIFVFTALSYIILTGK